MEKKPLHRFIREIVFHSHHPFALFLLGGLQAAVTQPDSSGFSFEHQVHRIHVDQVTAVPWVVLTFFVQRNF
jgi:hypothetical protein